ncbi:hypothetical protein M758_3G067300 [Ceratodon purpureus]|uniref:Longin domain-containing protein n=1 Tax=Ceratodon purpureus TaxID=3225 RepID=A0A8T0IJA4_CERPU|nr:hypothetical protein KC19_3G067900 [Ceratodon purpureus]KAG0622045.1 hypothetical protein M758_3G067300 [Ceratodon purpureus]
MAMTTSLVYYASVSRGSTVVAEHKKAREDLADVAMECLEKVPAFHNQFTYTIKQRVFIFLMDKGFTYCAIVDEALGKVKGFGFLEHVRDEFNLLLRSRGLDGARLERNALVTDFAGVFKHLVKPLVGIPQKEVDLNDEHHSDSKDETALSPSASRAEHSQPGPAALTPNGHTKTDKKSTKHQQVVQVKEIMMTNSGKALDKCQKLEGGGGSSDMDHGGNRKLKGRQVASRMWWRNVKLVLILDLVVCCLLFAIWLGICKGFTCVKSS